MPFPDNESYLPLLEYTNRGMIAESKFSLYFRVVVRGSRRVFGGVPMG